MHHLNLIIAHIAGFLRGTLTVLLLVGSISAQGNGSDLAFQGLANSSMVGVSASAMGNAFTANLGNINSLYFNCAGLATINNTSFSLASKNTSRSRWERKMWGDQEGVVLVSPILDGRYVPPAGLQNVTDDSLWSLIEIGDLEIPEGGKYHYEKSIADWIHDDDSNLPFNEFSLVIPINGLTNPAAIGFAVYRKYDIMDFDRNDSHTDPFVANRVYMHHNYQVTDDTAHVNWSKFLRSRTGAVNGYKAAFASRINENINIGLGLTMINGETDDRLSLERIAEFVMWAKDFVFSHDTLHTVTTGNSKFTGLVYDAGLILSYPGFNLGLSVTMPYNLIRKWSYSTSVSDPDTTVFQKSSGKDRVIIPATYSLGVNIKANDDTDISIDIVYNPYSSSDSCYDKYGYGDAVSDSTQYSWKDQLIFRIGAKFRFNENLNIKAGYQSLPGEYVPWGVADRS